MVEEIIFMIKDQFFYFLECAILIFPKFAGIVCSLAVIICGIFAWMFGITHNKTWFLLFIPMVFFLYLTIVFAKMCEVF